MKPAAADTLSFFITVYFALLFWVISIISDFISAIYIANIFQVSLKALKTLFGILFLSSTITILIFSAVFFYSMETSRYYFSIPLLLYLLAYVAFRFCADYFAISTVFRGHDEVKKLSFHVLIMNMIIFSLIFVCFLVLKFK